MRVNQSKFIYWTPRVLSILFILFLMLFSLDVFDGASGPWEIALGLFMHNIPALILLIILMISWKHEIVGGITFILAGLLYIVSSITRNQFGWWFLIIAGPAFFIGILFLIGWRRKIGNKQSKN